LEQMVQGEISPVSAPGKLDTLDIRQAYLEHLVPYIHAVRGIKAVIDCSDGMASVFIHDVMRKVRGEIITMYDQPDGSFPHHPPNPLIEANLSDVKKRTLAEKAELGMAAYGCSKAALKMLTRCMAREWAQFGIQVNAVGPGLTKTDFSKPIWSNPEVAKHVSAAIPMGRLAEPEEIVGSVLFLASDAARFITGHSIYIDGGALTT